MFSQLEIGRDTTSTVYLIRILDPSLKHDAISFVIIVRPHSHTAIRSGEKQNQIVPILFYRYLCFEALVHLLNRASFYIYINQPLLEYSSIFITLIILSKLETTLPPRFLSLSRLGNRTKFTPQLPHASTLPCLVVSMVPKTREASPSPAREHLNHTAFTYTLHRKLQVL